VAFLLTAILLVSVCHLLTKLWPAISVLKTGPMAN